jgi:hypothetical protein
VLEISPACCSLLLEFYTTMKPMLMSTFFWLTLAHAQINPRLDDVIKRIDIPPEFQSLIESVELRASSVVGHIQSAFSSAATAIPTDLLSAVAGILPTPAQSTSGAISGTESYLGLTLAMAGAAAMEYVVD